MAVKPIVHRILIPKMSIPSCGPGEMTGQKIRLISEVCGEFLKFTLHGCAFPGAGVDHAIGEDVRNDPPALMLLEDEDFFVGRLAGVLVTNRNKHLFFEGLGWADAEEFGVGILGFENRISSPINRLTLRGIAGLEPQGGKIRSKEGLRNGRVLAIVGF